jgi:hypothetical protein
MRIVASFATSAGCNRAGPIWNQLRVFGPVPIINTRTSEPIANTYSQGANHSSQRVGTRVATANATSAMPNQTS